MFAFGVQPAQAVDVPVQAIVVSDDDGGRRARLTGAQFARWVAFANASFREAEVRFVFAPEKDLSEVRSTTLNDMTGGSDADWPVTKELGNEVAARHPKRLVVFVRHGPGPAPSGAGFAGVDHDFVVLGGFDDMHHCGHPHLDALAHELGHWLGLPHTFVGEPFRDAREAAAHLAAHGEDPAAFDGDGFSDTLPDPGIRSLECVRTDTVELNGQSFRLPRRNLMSYYDERDSLSPQQIARARWVLERRQRHGLRLPRNRPGPRAVEAEDLEVLGSEGCSAAVQDMTGFGVGSWSGGAQLFCGAERGSVLTLELPVARPGTYRLVLHATLAPDFGVLQVSFDGRPCGPPLDLYAPLVLPSGPLSLDHATLTAGRHRLSLEVTGKHAAATGHRFGIDAIQLVD